MSSSTPPSPPLKRKHRLRKLGVAIALLLVLAAAGHAWLTSHGDEILRQELAKHGIYLTYKARSWLPWRGVRLTDATLHHDSTNSHPVIAFSSLDVSLPWYRIMRTHAFVTLLKAYDAHVALHDEEGSMTFEHLNAAAFIHPGQIEFVYMIADNGTLHFDVSGEILSTPAPQSEPPADFSLSLAPLRAMCSTLNFTEGSGRFSIRGHFVLDHRTENHTWKADLSGSSQKINWRGLPLESSQLHGQLSDTGMQIGAELRFVKGSTKLDATMKSWDNAPLDLKGTLSDAGGNADEVTASYRGENHTFTISQLSGRANLLDFLQDHPALAPYYPNQVKLRTLPQVQVTDLSWQTGTSPPRWSLKSIHLKSGADLTWEIGGHELAVDHLTGQASYDKAAWQLEGLEGQTLGGEISLKGAWEEHLLHHSALKARHIHMAKLRPWLEESKEPLGEAVLALNYEGSLGAHASSLSGSGFLEMADAPLVHVPILDQTYALFERLLPGVKRCESGQLHTDLQADKGVVKISDFKAIGGSVTVTANGRVNLVNREVAARARGNLRGAVGIVTSPLSHLLEMEVSGPIDDIEVRPIGPLHAFNAAGEEVKEKVKDATESTGSTILKGIKMPLKALGHLFGKDSPESNDKR